MFIAANSLRPQTWNICKQTECFSRTCIANIVSRKSKTIHFEVYRYVMCVKCTRENTIFQIVTIFMQHTSLGKQKYCYYEWSVYIVFVDIIHLTYFHTYSLDISMCKQAIYKYFLQIGSISFSWIKISTAPPSNSFIVMFGWKLDWYKHHKATKKCLSHFSNYFRQSILIPTHCNALYILIVLGEMEQTCLPSMHFPLL